MGKFRRADFPVIAEYICDEFERRKNNRSDTERQWEEIDRQVAMIPDTSYKKIIKGDRVIQDPEKAWMPEIELPLQAQSLEVLTADARRMLFPDSGPWFAPHCNVTDDYLQNVDFESIISGDSSEVPTQITQDACDQMVHGVLNQYHRQYDFYENVDRINAEAFTYGIGLGRARLITKEILINKSSGVIKKTQRFPVLIPKSIRNTYLDDRVHSIMNEGFSVGPAYISCWKQSLQDLKVAAREGSNDPTNENGGWMQFGDVKPDKHGNVELLEYEGDLVVPRKTTGNIHIPGAICTIIRNEKKVIRFRLRQWPFSSFIEFPYHIERTDTPYPASPLMKGWPIQKLAVDAACRLSIVAALNGGPPVSYDPDDPNNTGGPKVKPFAKWATTGEVKVHLIGDPQALLILYQGYLQQYYDVVGVSPPRMGAKTVSHTTAYAKGAEIDRGEARTVDYVRNCLKGPLARWLDMEYQMGRSVMKTMPVYIPAYNGFVDIGKDYLPENVVFDAHGSGEPQEKQMKDQKKLQALQMAMSMDQLGVAMGQAPVLDLRSSIEEVLREGGWTDTDVIINSDTTEPGMGAGGGGVEASPGAALQTLAFGGGPVS